MVWKELMNALREEGIVVTEAKVRWLLASGRIARRR